MNKGQAKVQHTVESDETCNVHMLLAGLKKTSVIKIDTPDDLDALVRWLRGDA